MFHPPVQVRATEFFTLPKLQRAPPESQRGLPGLERGQRAEPGAEQVPESRSSAQVRVRQDVQPERGRRLLLGLRPGTRRPHGARGRPGSSRNGYRERHREQGQDSEQGPRAPCAR